MIDTKKLGEAAQASQVGRFWMQYLENHVDPGERHRALRGEVGQQLNDVVKLLKNLHSAGSGL